ncbi:Spy/CpxP family protein refolding chaperone [Pseudomonas sp. EL_65y_Pfl2_R95]|uniref:Spy/CpxP family protein refolding chaperone n=1 Tax=Pseudomonas sp. EL_65y_Pfl2_R95 TaxID=3088698 RepID=UPI0030DA1296
MRKTLTAVLLALTLPTLAMAATDGAQHDGKGHRGAPIFKDLDLSKEQRQDVRKLMGEQMKTRHEITKRYLEKLPEKEQQAMKAEMKASFDKQQAAMRSLLNPEQQKKFDEHVKKMEERRAEKMKTKAE